jgi:hypothetical protein
MPDCEFCSRYFRDEYKLQRHREKIHHAEEAEEEEDDSGDTESESEEASDEDSETDNEKQSNEDGEEEEEEEEDEYDPAFGPLLENVFNRFEDERKMLVDGLIEKGYTQAVASHKAHESLMKNYQKALREEFRTSMQHWEHMKKHPTYKAIMKTAKTLQDDDFDKDESIDAAISQRKHLLNRIMPAEPMAIDEEDNDDDKSVTQ